LDVLGPQKIEEIADKIPVVSNKFLDDNHGQLRESVMDQEKIPRFETGGT